MHVRSPVTSKSHNGAPNVGQEMKVSCRPQDRSAEAKKESVESSSLYLNNISSRCEVSRTKKKSSADPKENTSGGNTEERNGFKGSSSVKFVRKAKDDAASEHPDGRKNKDENDGKSRSSGKSGTSGSEKTFPLPPSMPFISGSKSTLHHIRSERRDDEQEFSLWNDQARPPECVPDLCEKRNEKLKETRMKQLRMERNTGTMTVLPEDLPLVNRIVTQQFVL